MARKELTRTRRQNLQNYSPERSAWHHVLNRILQAEIPPSLPKAHAVVVRVGVWGYPSAPLPLPAGHTRQRCASAAGLLAAP